MTQDQAVAVKNAQSAFIAALDAGVEEDSLIEAVFEASMKRELYRDAIGMMTSMFEADIRWFDRLCSEELSKTDISATENTPV